MYNPVEYSDGAAHILSSVDYLITGTIAFCRRLYLCVVVPNYLDVSVLTHHILTSFSCQINYLFCHMVAIAKVQFHHQEL
jgi:hypothetical protein